MRLSVHTVCAAVIVVGMGATLLIAQDARGGGPPRSAGTSTTAAKPDATLAQLMRGIVYPASNVVFAAQGDLTTFPPPSDPAVSPNPLTSTYGGWQAVENASLALSESGSLLLLPGRLCSNGKPVPVRRADWVKYVQGLRQAGLTAYKAAQKKDQDAMVEATGALADACSACHEVYRDRSRSLPDRCTP